MKWGPPVLAESVETIARSLPEDALVLDVGAWGRPFTRADWVVDIEPWETRGLYGVDGMGPERFGPETWVQFDICRREPWPFADNQFDFVVCSHTLEDIRDPLWVCSEINRVGRAGYLETPSRLEEQCFGVQGPWVGWGHHRWIVEMSSSHVEFTFKHHVMHGRPTDHFPRGFHSLLSASERVARMFWKGSFSWSERGFDGPEQLDRWLSEFVTEQLNSRGWDENRTSGPQGRASLRKRVRAALRELTGHASLGGPTN